MQPYLDLPGFYARTVMPMADAQLVEGLRPGFIEGRLALAQSHVNARLRKRYGNAGGNAGSGIPFGRSPAPPTAIGTNPPAVSLTGTPNVGSQRLVLAVVLAGAVGAAAFQWSQDNGVTWNIGGSLAGTGTTPPAVSCSGTLALSPPSLLEVAITTGGARGTALFQWSSTGGASWNIGQQMAGSGASPPPVLLSGVSNLALPSLLQVQITTPGSLGVALYQWSQDGGSTWTTGVQTSASPTQLGATGLSVSFGVGTYSIGNNYQGQGIATAASFPVPGLGVTLGFAVGTYATNNVYAAQGITITGSVVLTGTGVTANFPAGTYATDNVYSAATPVPEEILGWMTMIVTPDVYRARGVNPQDPQLELLEQDRTRAFAELKEAADSETGLLDLPTNESGDSAVTTGGPLGCSDTSPYRWQDRQAGIGRRQDGRSELGGYDGGSTDPNCPEWYPNRIVGG